METDTDAATSTKSKHNHVEFSDHVDQTTNSERRESFFQHYLRRFSGSGSGNLLSVNIARIKPPSIQLSSTNHPQTSTNKNENFLSLVVPSSSSSSVVLDLNAARQLPFKNHNNFNVNSNNEKNNICDKGAGDKRLSLLGRPIIYRSSRSRNVIYRVHQIRIYNFLERPRTCLGFFYHLSM